MTRKMRKKINEIEQRLNDNKNGVWRKYKVADGRAIEKDLLISEAERHAISAAQMKDIEDYTLKCFAESKVGLPLNPRLTLTMIIEIRQSRKDIADLLNIIDALKGDS